MKRTEITVLVAAILIAVIAWFALRERPADLPPAAPEPAGLVDAGAPAETPDPAPDPVPESLRFDVVRVEADGQTVVAGVAPPGSSVELVLGGEVVASAEADGRGDFIAIFQVPPSDEPRELFARVPLPSEGAGAGESPEPDALEPDMLATAPDAPAPGLPEAGGSAVLEVEETPPAEMAAPGGAGPASLSAPALPDAPDIPAPAAEDAAVAVAEDAAPAAASPDASLPEAIPPEASPSAASVADVADPTPAEPAAADTVPATPAVTSAAAPAATPAAAEASVPPPEMPGPVAASGEPADAASVPSAPVTPPTGGAAPLPETETDTEAAAEAGLGGLARTEAGAAPAPRLPAPVTVPDETRTGFITGRPVVILPGAAPDEAPVVLSAGVEGVRLVQPPPRSAAEQVTLDAISYGETGEVILTGRGGGGSAVRVYLDGKPVGEGQIATDGSWEARLAVEGQGPFTLRIDETAAGGEVLSRAESPFQRARLSGGPLRASQIIVQPGNNLWTMAEQVYGEGIRYHTIFSANSGQIRDPDLIYPGQVFELPGAAER